MWRTGKDDLILFGPDAWRKHQAVFPQTEDIRRLGSPYSDEWNFETVISLGTELVIMNRGELAKTRESGVIEKLGVVMIEPIPTEDRPMRAARNALD